MLGVVEINCPFCGALLAHDIGRLTQPDFH